MTPYSISLPLENSVNITSSMIGDDAKLLIRKVRRFSRNHQYYDEDDG
jgi:hypothetical protein